MDKAFILIVMELFMRVIGLTIIKMEKEGSYGLMGVILKGCIKMGKKMGLGSMCGRMGVIMRGIGLIIEFKDMGSMCG
jgi:hypothetical protein